MTWRLQSWCLAIVSGLSLIASPASGDTVADRWTLGLHVGTWKQVGGEADYSNFGPATGLRFGYGLSDHLSVDLGFAAGWTRPGVGRIDEEAGITFSSETDLYTRIWQPSLTLRYRFVPDGRWRPWASVGLGATRWDVLDQSGDDPGLWPTGPASRVRDEDGAAADGFRVEFTSTFGLGTEIAVNDHWSFDLGVRFHYWFGNDRDSVGLSTLNPSGGVDVNFGPIEALAGVNYTFGTADRDGDGIPDSIDVDPDRPEDRDGYEDADGAPDLDNDGDGIPDDRDGAPNDPEDFDGFQDTDGVPDTDNDGDGIADVDDGAPNDAEDFDGFQDADGVPDPDNDGDGVLDASDLCPGTPANVRVDARGCPVVEEIREDLVLEGVEFAPSSAELTPASRSTLLRVAESLRAWPEVRIEIGGHTDSVGSASFNRELSRQRAESVRQFLIGEGVDPDRMVAAGYGEGRPIRSNATVEGRAANRRVEVRRIE